MHAIGLLVALAVLALLVSGVLGKSSDSGPSAGRQSPSDDAEGPSRCRVCKGDQKLYDTPDGSGRPCPECGGSGWKHA